MPIFIDELIIRGEVVGSAGLGPVDRDANSAALAAEDRQILIAEVTQAVIDHFERALERIGER